MVETFSRSVQRHILSSVPEKFDQSTFEFAQPWSSLCVSQSSLCDLVECWMISVEWWLNLPLVLTWKVTKNCQQTDKGTVSHLQTDRGTLSHSQTYWETQSHSQTGRRTMSYSDTDRGTMSQSQTDRGTLHRQSGEVNHTHRQSLSHSQIKGGINHSHGHAWGLCHTHRQTGD